MVGNFWERMVRSVSESLRRTLCRCRLQELQTVLTEVKAINPLTENSDTEALIPWHS